MEDLAPAYSSGAGKKYATERVKKLKERASSFFELSGNESDLVEPRSASKMVSTPTWAQDLFSGQNVPRRISGAEKESRHTPEETRKIHSETPRGISSYSQDIRDILEIAPDDVAKQLTLLTADLFRKIPRGEILSMGWTGSQKWQVAPKICKITDQFNQTAIWVAQQILEATEIRKRFQLICFYIRVAKSCYNWNNFDGMRAVVSGLQSTPVHRLERTWAMVSRREMAVFEKLCVLTSADNNSEAYRRRLEQIKPPLIPNLGIHLGDITFVYECMKKDRDNEDRQDQYRDREIQYHDMIQALAKWQASCVFQFPVDEYVTTLLKSAIESIKPEQIKETVDEHYKASYRIEAKPISLSSPQKGASSATSKEPEKIQPRQQPSQGRGLLAEYRFSMASMDQLTSDLKIPRRGKSAGGKVPDEQQRGENASPSQTQESPGKSSGDDKYASLPLRVFSRQTKIKPTLDTILTSPTDLKEKTGPMSVRIPTSASSSVLESNLAPLSAALEKVYRGIPSAETDEESAYHGDKSFGKRGFHARATSEGYPSPTAGTVMMIDSSGDEEEDMEGILEPASPSPTQRSPSKGRVMQRLIHRIKNKQRSNTVDAKLRPDVTQVGFGLANLNDDSHTRLVSIDNDVFSQEDSLRRSSTVNVVDGRRSFRLSSTGVSRQVSVRARGFQNEQYQFREDESSLSSQKEPLIPPTGAMNKGMATSETASERSSLSHAIGMKKSHSTDLYPASQLNPSRIQTKFSNATAESDSSNGSQSSLEEKKDSNASFLNVVTSPVDTAGAIDMSPTSSKKPVASLVLQGVLKRKYDKRTTTDALIRKKKWYRVWTVLDHWTLSFYSYRKDLTSSSFDTHSSRPRPQPASQQAQLFHPTTAANTPAGLIIPHVPLQHPQNSDLTVDTVNEDNPSSRTFFGYKKGGRSSSSQPQYSEAQARNGQSKAGASVLANASTSSSKGMTRSRSGTSPEKLNSSQSSRKEFTSPMNELLECIPLKTHSTVTILPDTKSKGRCILQVSPDFNTYVILRCKNSNELQLWVQGIRTAIDMLKKETEHSAATS